MTIKEILAIEKENEAGELLLKTPTTANGNDAPEPCINLFKEGIFWRVYQKSAYAFTQQVKNLKVMKKLFKIVNCGVVYASFPDSILSQIEALSISKGFTFKKCTEKQYRISGIAEDTGFEEWKNSIELSPLPRPLGQGQLYSFLYCPAL
jgi:hypothetical protein